MHWLDRIPTPLLVGLAIFMLGAPFLPEPHLVEKLRMLADGQLTRLLDIFDAVWHLLPTVLLGLKLILVQRSHKDRARDRTPRQD